jgi:solute carrier family 13 (sodium-dependent dicarboxylate transporter), member 2/3/5
MRRRLSLGFCVFAFLFILAAPTHWIPLPGLTVVEQRLAAIFVLAALLWIFEPVPVFSTSILVIVAQLVLVSDRGLAPLMRDAGTPGFGQPLDYKAIMASFASPVVMLFVGGFFLAAAATKYRLDTNLARWLIRPFGRRPAAVLLGLMLITAVFSMFMSNTATTAMMLTLLIPVLGSLPAGDPGRTAFALAIPFAANLGGIATPIGTPPNAIALKYLAGANAIGFGQWMAFALPYTAFMLFLLWLLLWRLYPSNAKAIDLEIRGSFLKNGRALTVYITTAATVLLWLSDALHGMNAYIVALVPVAVFSLTGVIGAQDLRRMSWDVLWLVAGGIALGQGLVQSGLSSRLVHALPFEALPPYVLVLILTLTALLMSSLISNTAMANLLLPIVAALGTQLPALVQVGGAKGLILLTTLACSLAMALPVSTPPNALAHATGMVSSRQMARVGVGIGLAGLALAYLLAFVLQKVGFL